MGQRERILVLYNEPVLAEGHPDYISEVEVLDNVEAVQEALIAAGYEVARLGATSDPQVLLNGLRDHAPHAVVNLFEGAADNNASELYACGLLEWLGIPYTGCPFHTLVLARSKHIAKRLFVAGGLPTAPFFVAEQFPLVECPIRFPVIVKPAQQDASVGVDQKSVATDLESLNARISYLVEQFGGPVLVEEFIFGREVTVALVEMPDLRLLPATEAVFPDAGPGYWPILSYDAKWTRGSTEYETTDYHFHAQMSPELQALVEGSARKAFRLLGARDYARVDFRIRAGDNQPFLLELNPNPDFAPDRALANNLWAAGLSHTEFTVQLVRNALARGAAGTRTARYRDLEQASQEVPYGSP
jgi:D-alanine-D-alanine ligase